MVKSLLFAVLFAACLLLGLEAYLRATGMAHSAANEVNLWCLQRDRVPGLGREDVVLLGSSRLQQDFSTSTFRRRYPQREVVQLAIDASRPFSLLEDLADNTQFNGLVLCDTHLHCMSQMNARVDVSRDWRTYYHREWNPNRKLNCVIQQAVRKTFVAASPKLGLTGLARSLGARRLSPRGAATAFDRQTLVNYHELSPESLAEDERMWSSRLQPEHSRYVRRGRRNWEQDARRTGELIRKIERRGGRVVFVVLPVSGGVLREYDRLFPRPQFWEPFLRLSGASGLDCTRLPAFAGFKCPEGSHLNYDQSPEFTDLLCSELERIKAL